MITKFDPKDLSKLYKPDNNSTKTENGQVTVIAGSKLFHGPPLMILKVASRLVDMVFLASPEPSVGRTAENLKSQLSSFIWTPWADLESYIEKSDACLIGPGLMRYGGDSGQGTGDRLDTEGEKTKEITERLLKKFKNKKWVIDGGSLQVMDAEWIPEGAILTPNQKEYQILFKNMDIESASKKYKCVIVLKGAVTIVSSQNKTVEVYGGNAGLTKGGTGDVEAGLTTALLAKNDPFLAATVGSYITKLAADNLFKKVGFEYNSDDLANEIPQILR